MSSMVFGKKIKKGLRLETCDWRVVPSGGRLEAGDWGLEAWDWRAETDRKIHRQTARKRDRERERELER